jgi:hypothetical protein
MSQQQPSRETLVEMASALAREGETARLLATYLVSLANDHDLANAVRHVVRSFTQAPSPSIVTNHVVALVEAERPAFFDPNRPGE